jgi:hypothetical protein
MAKDITPESYGSYVGNQKQVHGIDSSTIVAAVDDLQADDLRGFPQHPELVEGLTLRAQLELVHNAWHEPGMLARLNLLSEENAMRCNLTEFISQPIIASPLTHAIGHVVHVQAYEREQSVLQAAGTDIEIALSADGVEFLIGASSPEGPMATPLPSEGELIHVCGTMYLYPSFCNNRLVSTVTGRIRRISKCTDFADNKQRIWGLVALEIDSRIVKPDLEVYNPHAPSSQK